MDAAAFWAIHGQLPAIGKCFLELMFLTRQRPTEIRLLRESQIKNGRIWFKPTKTERSSGAEVAPLVTPEIEISLARARALVKVKSLPRGDGYLIQTAGGTAFTKSGLHSMWKRACAAAGVEGVTTRDVRPFALATMERMGYTLREIQKAAAHTDQSTTEGYLNQHRDSLSDARIFLPETPKT
jgi:integrase